jgi:hypothetical protein
MNIRERIENNLIVFFLSTLLTGFLAGIATYEGILRITNQQTLLSCPSTQKKEEAIPLEILLVAGNQTILRDFNIAVKLGGIDNYEPKNRTVLLRFYYPLNPAERLTGQNINDNSVSWVGYSLEPDGEKQIALGEVGVFAVSIRNLRFNEQHDLVQSLELVIKD